MVPLAPAPIPTPVPKIAPTQLSQTNMQVNQQRPSSIVALKKQEVIERATSPVDERILKEFYTDPPKNMHQYSLEGKQYFVYEGVNLSDIESYRKGN